MGRGGGYAFFFALCDIMQSGTVSFVSHEDTKRGMSILAYCPQNCGMRDQKYPVVDAFDFDGYGMV